MFALILIAFLIQNPTDIKLDLKGLAELAVKVKSIEDFEKQLNTLEGHLVLNNVDLNKDNKIDFITIREKRRISINENGAILFVLEIEDKLIAEVIYKSPRFIDKKIEVSVSGTNDFYSKSNIEYVINVDSKDHLLWLIPFWKNEVSLNRLYSNKISRRTDPYRAEKYAKLINDRHKYRRDRDLPETKKVKE